MSRVPFTAAAVLSLTAMFFVMGCGPDATAPPDLGQISLLIVSGNGQSGVVGTELPQPLVIKATNSKGAIISGLTVNFRVTNGNGSMFAGSATTDGKGIAADYWTLGTSTIQQQRVEVRAVSSAGTKQVFGVFSATTLPGPAAQIATQAGDGQTANTSSSVPIAPAVMVRDQYANPVPSIGVTFAVATGGGSVVGGNAITNASGIATVGSWTLGSAPGTNLLTATASGSGIAGNPVTFTATAVVPSNPWTAQASMPTARWLLAAGVVNGILYAVGGKNDGTLATVEAYDPATNTWTTKASMSTARWLHAAGVVNGILYAVGGNNGFDDVATVEAYDPATNTWTTKAPMSNARRGLAAGVVDGTLYAVGGVGSGTVEAYDPATNTWTMKAPMLTARYGSAAGVVNGILYVVGGYNNGDLATVEAYDPATNTWTTKASMPTAREVLSVGVVNGILYAVGGFTDSNGFMATVEAYDPATNTWTTKASMPTARYALGAGVVNGTLYAIGGYNTNGILATVEAYHP
jgi:hypothetical protein